MARNTTKKLNTIVHARSYLETCLKECRKSVEGFDLYEVRVEFCLPE